jgi:serine/threonine protein kinase
VLFIKANILIDQDGRARLADFGLLTIALDSTYTTSSSSPKSAGTARWMSPELLDPDQFDLEDSRPTKDSDCYALGMVILEVLSGKPPFPNYNGLIAMRKIVEGELPGRPQGAEEVWFTDDLWEMLEQCWSPQPGWRPTIEAVLQCLKRGSTAWQPLPPDLHDHVQSDSDDQSNFSLSHDLGMFPILS